MTVTNIDQLRELLQSIATIAVQAQHKLGPDPVTAQNRFEDVSDLLGDISGDLDRANALVNAALVADSIDAFVAAPFVWKA